MRNTPCHPECSCSCLNSLALMGYSRKKSKQGGLGAYFLVGKPPGSLISLLLYPWDFWTKRSLTPENPTKLCYKNMLHLWNFKTKKQDTNFVDVGISTCSLTNPIILIHMLFLITPGNCMPSTLLFVFFPGMAQWMLPIANNYQSETTW